MPDWTLPEVQAAYAAAPFGTRMAAFEAEWDRTHAPKVAPRQAVPADDKPMTGDDVLAHLKTLDAWV